jgi:hypothetical protein
MRIMFLKDFKIGYSKIDFKELSKGARVLQFPSQMGITHYYISVFTVLIILTFVFLSEVKSRTGAYPYLGSEHLWTVAQHFGHFD